MTSVLAIRHVEFEGLGVFGKMLAGAGCAIRYAEAGLDDLSAIDPLEPELLVVLGGPIGAYEDDIYPFLGDELRLLEMRLAAGRPVLGICLGAQLIARALGARVYGAARKEIGWAPVTLSEAGRQSPLRHIEGKAVLHWHGDTFDLPQGADLLASTQICPHQAFAWGPAALGLQFHLEAEPAGIERWLIGHAGEIAATPGITVPQLREDTRRHGPVLTEPAMQTLREWLTMVWKRMHQR